MGLVTRCITKNRALATAVATAGLALNPITSSICIVCSVSV